MQQTERGHKKPVNLNYLTMKKIITTIALSAIAFTSFAGGLLTNTNQSASFVRNPARYASLETDAIYFNPAGTAFFEKGWRVSANWQMVWQSRDITSHVDNKQYGAKIYVPVMPSVMASYSTGKWSFSGFFGIPGGGGNCSFDNGLPMFNQLGNGFKELLPIVSGAQATGDAYSAFQSTQYVFGLQLGAAYRILDNLSAYVGVRGNYTSASYNGAINFDAMSAKGATKVSPLSLDLTQKGISVTPIIGIDYKVGNFNFAAKYEFRAVTNLKNNTKNLGIFGENYNKGVAKAGENIGTKVYQAAYQQAYQATYDAYIAQGAPAEMAEQNATANATNIATQKATQVAGEAGGKLGMLSTLEDGKRLRNDAPASLSLGASWQATPWFKAMISGNYYFDKNATVESLLGGANNNKNLAHDTYEIAAGLEFNVTKNLLLSAGVQYTDFGITNEYTSDLSFVNDSFMTGFGGKYSINEHWDINAGFCFAVYKKDKNTLKAATYERDTYNATIGVDFKF